MSASQLVTRYAAIRVHRADQQRDEGFVERESPRPADGSLASPHPRGGAIHSADEFLIVDSLAERAQLSALTMMRIAERGTV